MNVESETTLHIRERERERWREGGRGATRETTQT